jgi:nitrilase
VAVVQAAPVAFDVERTLQKLGDLTSDASRRGAHLTLFPEAFVSGYPRGLDFGAVVGSRTPEGREHFRRHWESAIEVPGPHVDRMAGLARSNRTTLVVGVVERSGGTLYCTAVFLGSDGRFLGKHR